VAKASLCAGDGAGNSVRYPLQNKSRASCAFFAARVRVARVVRLGAAGGKEVEQAVGAGTARHGGMGLTRLLALA